MAQPQTSDGGKVLQIWRVVANILNNQLWAANKGNVILNGTQDLGLARC
jgi:hypothetical protein